MGVAWTQAFDGISGQERRVLVVGPTGAGKRSMLNRLRQATGGPLLESYRACKFDCFAIGSWDTTWASGKIRTFWQHYYVGISDLVVVVDSSDPGQIQDVKQVLAYMLDDPRLANASVLVFANKQDIATAIPPATLAQDMGLPRLCSHTWHVQGCSVTGGEGLSDGWRWLKNEFESRGFLERGLDVRHEDCTEDAEALLGPYIVTVDDLEVTEGEADGKGGFAPWRPWSGACIDIGSTSGSHKGFAPLFLSSGDYVEILEVRDCRRHLLDFYGRISSPEAGWIPLNSRKLRRTDFVVTCQLCADDATCPTLVCTNLAGCKLAEYRLRCPEDETVEDVLAYLSSHLSIDRRSLNLVSPDGQLFGPSSVSVRVMDVFDRKGKAT